MEFNRQALTLIQPGISPAQLREAATKYHDQLPNDITSAKVSAAKRAFNALPVYLGKMNLPVIKK